MVSCMTEAIIVAVITGCFTLAGTVLAVISSSRKASENLRISQAVTDTKIDELTREVREHNNFAARMPVVEEQIAEIKRDTDTLAKRISEVERRAAG